MPFELQLLHNLFFSVFAPSTFLALSAAFSAFAALWLLLFLLEHLLSSIDSSLPG